MATTSKGWTLARKLRLLSACDEAVLWVGDRTLAEAWDECERLDWMLWLCGRMVGNDGWPTRQQVILAACACAETVLHLVKPGEDRPRIAIETARAWVDGKATIEQVRRAAAASSAAASSAAAHAAAHAAHAAAAAAHAAAGESEQQAKMCAMLRDMLTIPEEL